MVIKNKEFVINKTRVLNALRWLKINNPYYASIEINMDKLDVLPTDNIDINVDINIIPDLNEDDNS